MILYNFCSCFIIIIVFISKKNKMFHMWVPLPYEDNDSIIQEETVREVFQVDMIPEFRDDNISENYVSNDEYNDVEYSEDDFSCSICLSTMKVPSSFYCDLRKANVTECYGGNICFECGIKYYKLYKSISDRDYNKIRCISCNKKQKKTNKQVSLRDLIPNFCIFDKIHLQNYNCGLCGNTSMSSHRDLYNHYKNECIHLNK